MKVRINEYRYASNGKSGDYVFIREEEKTEQEIRKVLDNLKFSPVQMQYRIDVVSNEGVQVESIFTVNPVLFDYPIKEPEPIYSTGAKTQEIHELVLFIYKTPNLLELMHNTFRFMKHNIFQPEIFSILFSNSLSEFNPNKDIIRNEKFKNEFYYLMTQIYHKWQS